MFVHGSAVLVAPGVALAARHVTEPEPNRRLRHTYPSAVRAILDDPPIRIRPIFPHRAGAKETNPVGSSHFGIPMMASTMPRSHQILLTTCRECVCKRLILCRGSHSQVASLRKRARSKPRWARKLGRAPGGPATQLGSFQFKRRLENQSAADSPDNDGFGGAP